MVGLVVGVAAPPVAVTPVSAGMEKNVFSHAAGAVAVMLASLVRVTVRVPPLAATVSGDVSVCDVPLVPVEKFQITSLGVAAEHPVWAVVSALFENPAAYVAFVGRFTAVMVTGKAFELLIVTTTSPFPPGNSRFVGDGEATAVIVRLVTVADCPCPLEPAPRPTIQLVAA